MQKNSNLKILAIDTSCDETAAAVTEGTKILSNVIWSQASLHAKYGGVLPSLAQRMHEERIDWVVNKALRQAQCKLNKIESVAVTCGPGLAIALGVGIKKAKDVAREIGVPIIGVNHTEGHVLSPLAEAITKNQNPRNKICFPALGLVVSGANTQLVLIRKIGDYQVLAEKVDDALGEALDKAARMLDLGYPGGAVLEKLAKSGNPKAYSLPLPMAGKEDRNEFSYSGLKTAFWRLTNNKTFSKQQICDLAASFQNRAFEHLTRVSEKSIRAGECKSIRTLLVGGGVGANVELRKRLRKVAKDLGMETRFPYSAKLYGDNAAMIGVVAGFKAARGEFSDPEKIDRLPRWSVDEKMAQEAVK